jgi:hypothetical protein
VYERDTPAHIVSPGVSALIPIKFDLQIKEEKLKNVLVTMYPDTVDVKVMI